MAFEMRESWQTKIEGWEAFPLSLSFCQQAFSSQICFGLPLLGFTLDMSKCQSSNSLLIWTLFRINTIKSRAGEVYLGSEERYLLTGKQSSVVQMFGENKS